MPELPEVETTRRGIAPLIEGRRITQVMVRNRRLRQPVSTHLAEDVVGQIISAVRRRGKYLLVQMPAGTLIIHLGMSGSLRCLPADIPPEKHDHIDIVFAHGLCLRLRDPRRFGLMVWTAADPAQHPLLKALGPEPFAQDFNADYLYMRSRRRTVPVKNYIMDSHVVVGVGNIYASEALFLAGITPRRQAGKVSAAEYAKLVAAIQQVLVGAIEAGGTTLRDFVDGTGRPGYFRQQLNVYGHAGEPCLRCGHAIRQVRLGQRASYYCPQCQH